jgi:hypothetical protein
MRIGMFVTEALQAGFALAATIARDSGAKHAHIGLAPDVSDAWCGVARDLERASKAERRDRIRKLTLAARPALSLHANFSPRALALLGAGPGRTSADGSVPTRSISSRAGYRPPPTLLAVLARIASRSGST